MKSDWRNWKKRSTLRFAQAKPCRGLRGSKEYRIEVCRGRGVRQLGQGIEGQQSVDQEVE